MSRDCGQRICLAPTPLVMRIYSVMAEKERALTERGLPMPQGSAAWTRTTVARFLAGRQADRYGPDHPHWRAGLGQVYGCCDGLMRRRPGLGLHAGDLGVNCESIPRPAPGARHPIDMAVCAVTAI